MSISIILSTYNESKNIINIIKSIECVLSNDGREAEIVVVDDNSPDGTSKLVQEYVDNNINNHKIKLITRKNKYGLSSAIILGIHESIGNIKIIMDSDFSHPPRLIPQILKMITKYNFKLIIASRYMNGGFIKNWPFFHFGSTQLSETL